MNQVNLKFEEKRELEAMLNALIMDGGKRFFINGKLDILDSNVLVHDVLFVYNKNVVRLKFILNKDKNNEVQYQFISNDNFNKKSPLHSIKEEAEEWRKYMKAMNHEDAEYIYEVFMLRFKMMNEFNENMAVEENMIAI